MNEAIPAHLGLILDGNRRWAKEQGLPTLEGHRVGYDNLKTIAEAAFERGVKYVSAYTFSIENWNRTQEEVSYLMTLALKVFSRDMREFQKKGYRIRWLGVPDNLSQKHLAAIREAEDSSKDNVKGTIGLCFNYGGRREIVEATKKVLDKEVKSEDLTEDLISKHLHAPDIPGIDLLVRTSGEQRLSNFMLWRAAYSELYFTKKYWPEFTVNDLDAALAEYASRHRRFGG